MEDSGGTKKKKRVVVIGGGVAGSLIAKTLQDHAHVVLIDSKDYFEIPWATLRSFVEPSFAERSLICHSEYLPKVHIITSAAINITASEVLTAQGTPVAYDYVVIATGHMDDGAHNKTQRIDQCQTEYEKIKSAKSILIVGGGPSGVGLAGEIAVDFPSKKVILVHRGPRLLEFIGSKAAKKTLNWLTSRNVDVIFGQTVGLNSASDGIYRTSGGETITADCHFICTGKPIGSSWLNETILNDSLDMHGRLMVDTYLRVQGHNNVFGIGDITNISEIKQGYLAHRHALVAAKNLKVLIMGGKECNMSTYSPSSPYAIVSLGRKEAVAQFYSMSIIGCIPGMIKSRDLYVGKTRKQLGLKD